MQLTPDEENFLRRYGYTPEQVFDGGRMRQKERGRRAKEAGCELVLYPSCRAGKGHRLTSRSGHCFQCNPKQKAFERKHGRPGYVYVAGSLRGKLLKIGTTDDLSDRLRTLCSEGAQGYAGFSDWRMLASIRTDNRGTLEDRVLARLRAFSIGADARVKEARRCSFELALEALQAEAGRERENQIELVEKNWQLYNFS